MMRRGYNINTTLVRSSMQEKYLACCQPCDSCWFNHKIVSLRSFIRGCSKFHGVVPGSHESFYWGLVTDSAVKIVCKE